MKYLLAILAVLWIGAASAEEGVNQAEPVRSLKPVECYPAPILKTSLESQYKEINVFTGGGVARGEDSLINVMVMLYVNKETNTFTVVELQEFGYACIIGAGSILQLGDMQGIKIKY
jgi:hypothetical protein